MFLFFVFLWYIDIQRPEDYVKFPVSEFSSVELISKHSSLPQVLFAVSSVTYTVLKMAEIIMAN